MIRDTAEQDEIIEETSSGLKKKYFLIFGAVLTIAILMTLLPSYQRWATAEQTIAKDRLRLASVVRGDLIRDVSAQGTIIASVKPTLFSPAIGVVTLHAKAGDSVSKGQLIAKIDSPELLNLLDQESAAVTGAQISYKRQQIQARKAALANQQEVDLMQVQLVAAQRELRRAVAAHDHGAISEFDFDKANDDVATAKLRFEHASQDAKLEQESLVFETQTSKLTFERQQLMVSELQRQVATLQILSPVTGIVGNLLVDNKDAVNKNQALLNVVDLSAFEVELRVPDSYASILALGLSAEVSHQGIAYAALLVAISPEVVNSQITAKVKFINSTPPNLKQNQRVSARILLEGKKDTLMVERGPFLESSGGRYTYLVEDELAKKVKIETGIVSVASVEILSGLTEGQTVIVSSLRDFNDADVVYLAN